MPTPHVMVWNVTIRDPLFQNSRRRESRSLLGADRARALGRCPLGKSFLRRVQNEKV